MSDNPLLRSLNAKIWIGDELFIVDCPESFARILEEKLGPDAAEYFRDCAVCEDSFDEYDCPGECDRLYDMQEGYERAINDALCNLEEAQIRDLGKPWTSGKVNVDLFNAAIHKLENVL